MRFQPHPLGLPRPAAGAVAHGAKTCGQRMSWHRGASEVYYRRRSGPAWPAIRRTEEVRVTQSYTLRPAQEYIAEQQFLNQRILDIEKGMGKVAARSSGQMPVAQNLDALDRARELTGDMFKQVRVRPLEEAIQAQLAWLDRAEASLGQDNGEPKIDLNRIALDRRLLQDIQTLWRAQGN